MEHSRAQTSGKVPTVSQNAGIIPLENGDSVNKNAQVCAQGFAQSCRLTNKQKNMGENSSVLWYDECAGLAWYMKYTWSIQSMLQTVKNI